MIGRTVRPSRRLRESAQATPARATRARSSSCSRWRIGLLFGILAIVIDVGNIWNTSLHVQHAAEAAALAGVPYMPGDFTTASCKAQCRSRQEWLLGRDRRDGDPGDERGVDRRLDVSVTINATTYFLGSSA